MQNKKFDQRKSEFEEKVLEIKRVTTVTKGGRQYGFSAAVAVGDKKGRVGIGTGKAKEVTDAIKKGIQQATKNVVKISLVDNRTISHEMVGISGAAKVLIKPAYEGTGVIAGGAVRSVLELAGVKDVLSKSLGSNTKLNVARATLDALRKQKSISHVAKLREKTESEILG